jgi:cell division protein FtsI (penicillin-binding protein 3)
VLEYLHVPPDLPLAPKHQLLLAQSKIADKDLADDTPDHPGEPLETAEVNEAAKPAALPRTPASATDAGANPVVQPALHKFLTTAVQPARSPAPPGPETKLPTTGTVVLDVEQGGIEVPSFVGKTFRGAVEAAQDAGLQLEAVGSGIARQQNPAAGTHVPAGSRVSVQFGR